LVNGAALAARAGMPLEVEEEVAAPPQPAALAPNLPKPVPPWNLTGYTPPHGSRVDLGPELLASLPRPAVEEVQKLKADLEKTTRVLRGLIDVLVERSLLTGEELRAAIAKIPK